MRAGCGENTNNFGLGIGGAVSTAGRGMAVKIYNLCGILSHIGQFDGQENAPLNWINLQGPWRIKVKTYNVLFGNCNETV